MMSSQAAAIGWRGHRYSSTRDYLVRPAAVMREEARRSLRGKRELWKLLAECPTIDATTAEDVVQARLEAPDAFGLVKTRPLSRDHIARAQNAAAAPFLTLTRRPRDAATLG
jgi:hypothetical protein